MDNIGIKIIFDDEVLRGIRIVRKYCDYSIAEIKDRIANNKYLIEGSYTNEDDISKILEVNKELCDSGIITELFEHDRITNIEFLNNLLDMYYGINEEINDRIDETVD